MVKCIMAIKGYQVLMQCWNYLKTVGSLTVTNLLHAPQGFDVKEIHLNLNNFDLTISLHSHDGGNGAI